MQPSVCGRTLRSLPPRSIQPARSRPAPRRAILRCNAAVEQSVQDAAAADGKEVAGGEREALGPVAAPSARPPRVPLTETLLMQGFGWESCKDGHWWKKVQAKIPELKAIGITHLWLPPPSQSVAPQGYLPGQLYNLNSEYGPKEELLELNRALLEAGIRPVCDIVINHRCADKQDENGVWNKYSDDVTHDGKPINWGRWAITGDDPLFDGTGNKDSGDDYEAAPDLDHHNPELRKGIIDWLNWLHRDMGFEGWRFDFVRGYAAKYVKEYIESTIGGDTFHVGENFLNLRWQDSHLDYNQDESRQMLADFVKESEVCTMFDFSLKGILQEAVKNTQYDRLRDERGKAPGLMGWWPEMACTFVENHDTGSTQQHWPFPSEHVMLGYAYILTHPGIPCLFWEHHYEWGLADEINNLVALRLRAGLRADSKLEILCAEHDMYVARIDDKVTVKLGPRFDMGDLKPDKGQGWARVAEGKDFAVWEKQG